MKKLLGALLAAGLLTLIVTPAEARFMEGYLAECTAITATTCTELTGGSYARQPISFGDPVKGVSFNRIPYSFGNISGTVAGRAVYDSATGGNLLVTMPLATALSVPPDQGDVGTLKVTVTGMVNVGNASLYSAPIAAGATFGTTGDGSNVSAVLASQMLRGEFLPRAAAADVDVLLDVTAGAPHVFQCASGLADEADEALDRAAYFILHRTRRPTAPSD